MMGEIWKDIVDYEGIYQVSNLGNVRSIVADEHYRSRILKPHSNGRGYLFVRLWKDKKGKAFLIHRLVALAFIPNPNNYPHVNHKSEVKTDNNVENLEWCTAKYNSNYGTCVERLIATRNERKRFVAEKVVLQCDLQGNIIQEWKSLMDIERNGYCRRAVQNFFKRRLKTYRSCLWIPKLEYKEWIEKLNLIPDPNYKEK